MPNKTPIAENDLKILEIISESSDVSQRNLVERSGLSLGMVNLILRRLAKTGYIKMVNLNKRKIEYLLTRKGLKEKANQSYTYLQRAIRIYKEYHDRVETIIDEQIKQGGRDLKVVGEGELADLVKSVLKEKHGALKRKDFSGERLASVVLDCNQSNGKSVKGISVLEKVLAAKERQRS